MTVDGIKAANTSGTWSGNSFTTSGVTFSILIDSDGNVVGIATSGTSSNYIYFILGYVDAEIGMIINGAPTGGDRYKWFQAIDTTSDFDYGDGATISTSVVNKKFMIVVANGVDMGNKIFYPMFRASGTTADFEPYSNICPISGHTGVNAVISPTTEASAGTTIAVSWQTEAGEVYGGEIDLVSGELTVTDGYIASYNGETLPSTWISDRDTCAEGTSPTTGAEVAYKMANPQTYQLGGNQIQSLLGNNNAWCDTGKVDIDYFAKEVTG